MFFGLNLFLYISFVSAHAEWVEIPQFSSKKSYMGVTPYSPYIYEHSVFPSTTPSYYDTMVHPMYETVTVETKKSITKLPDSIMKHMMLTTPMPSTKLPMYMTPPTRNTTQKVNLEEYHVNNRRPTWHIKKPKSTARTTTSTTRTTTMTTPSIPSPVSQVILDEHKFDEALYDDEDEGYEYVRDGEEEEYSDEEEPSDEYYDDNEYEGSDKTDKMDHMVNMPSDKGPEEYTYVGFLPYLQNIQSTLIRTSHKTIESKVNFLTDIKDRLLYTIKEKIGSLWSSRNRRTRSVRSDDVSGSWEKSEKGMSFPSNEGTLLTLGFLTFAVFLIKCVLQLVYAVKSKHHSYGGYPYYGNGIIVIGGSSSSTTTMATMMMGKRSIDDSEYFNVMDLIDKYNKE